MNSENKVYQAYYTKSEPIVKYMVNLLNLKGNETILEPCAGDGDFIDPIIEKFKTISIEAFELNAKSVVNLTNKYSGFKNISVKQTDTLTDIDLEFYCSMGGKYDAVIANPPYGAWRNTEERKQLKKRFNGFYAKESYSLFLYRSIESLKDGGRLVFIIPDTYLNLHMHKDIRKYILTQSKIEEIALFPSSYFPGVNFGYANLSIIALEKCSDLEICKKNIFNIITGYRSVNELGSSNTDNIKVTNLKQRDILTNSDFAFITNGNPKITTCIKKTATTIGDICNCVTGFYSGNDKEYLKVSNKGIRNSKKYDIVDFNKVTLECNESMMNGIEGDKFFVPIVKGGNTKYYKPDHWFMNWSSDLVKFYKKNKKARYQNASFYFKNGIAVPMISSSSITGAIINNRLFDQSIVGIFPKQIEYLEYLLAFFNSPTANSLIRTINPSTNNSSNYIKKIPYIRPKNSDLEKIKKNINLIVEQVKVSDDCDTVLEQMNNQIISNIYGF
jgi:adenine-specific DNA-methyltransferase